MQANPRVRALRDPGARARAGHADAGVTAVEPLDPGAHPSGSRGRHAKCPHRDSGSSGTGGSDAAPEDVPHARAPTATRTRPLGRILPARAVGRRRRLRPGRRWTRPVRADRRPSLRRRIRLHAARPATEPRPREASCSSSRPPPARVRVRLRHGPAEPAAPTPPLERRASRIMECKKIAATLVGRCGARWAGWDSNPRPWA